MTNEEKGATLATARATERSVTNPSQQQRTRHLTDAEMARWREYFEAHVAEAILAERAFMIEVCGQGIGEYANQLREEFEKCLDVKFKQVPSGPQGSAALLDRSG